MTITKLDEFSQNGEKSSTGLNLINGFPAQQRPQRRWFNWLFNTLASKINEIIDAVNLPLNPATINQSGIVSLVNDLVSGGTDKALTAEQGKILKGLIDVTLASSTITDNYQVFYIPLLNGQKLIIQTAAFNLLGYNSAGNPQIVTLPVAFPNKIIGCSLAADNSAPTNVTEYAEIDLGTPNKTTRSQIGVYSNFANVLAKYIVIGY